jgi:uncharacterized RDD family membrane protein YckC
VVPRSDDQPTNLQLPASGPFPPGTGEQTGPDQTGPDQPPPVPVPLWPPPPPHAPPLGEWPPPVSGTTPPDQNQGGWQAQRLNRSRPPVPLDALGRPLASWAKRVLALLVDFLLLSLLLSWFGQAVFPNLLSAPASSALPEGQALSFLGITALVWVGYLSLLGSSRRGQTLGMMLYGIAVRDLDGGPVNVGRAAIRSVILIAASGFLIDAFWPLWDPRRQALHDKPAHTVVVDVRLAALLQQASPGAKPWG